MREAAAAERPAEPTIDEPVAVPSGRAKRRGPWPGRILRGLAVVAVLFGWHVVADRATPYTDLANVDGYVVPIAVGMRWFPEHKGMITGLAVAGFGFGAMGWVKLAGNWGNLIESAGLASTFMIYGVAFAALVILGSFWMVMPPRGWQPAGYTPPVHKAGAGGEDFTQLEILRTPQFYMIFLTFAVSAGAGLMSIGLMKLYPMEALQAGGYTALEASAIAGTAMAVFFSIAHGPQA